MWLVPKAPTLFFAAGVLLVLVGAVAGVRYVQRDPMEYDLRKQTENDPQENRELDHAWRGVEGILGAGHGGMIVLTDTPADAHELETKLQADWDAAPENAKPFAAIHSLWDMVPEDQDKKVPLLSEIGERLERARARGFVKDEDWNRLKGAIPPRDLRPYGISDLPESIARAFAEKDGTRGTLVVIEPEPSNSSDLRYLIRYSDSFREAASGVREDRARVGPRGHLRRHPRRGRARRPAGGVALARAHRARGRDHLSRQGGWYALTVLFALLVGVAGEAAFLYATDIKLHFLNFAALPITFGIGVDYAVNVVQRYRADGSR